MSLPILEAWIEVLIKNGSKEATKVASYTGSVD